MDGPAHSHPRGRPPWERGAWAGPPWAGGFRGRGRGRTGRVWPVLPLLVVQLGVPYLAGLTRPAGRLDLWGAVLLVLASVLPGYAGRLPLPALAGTAAATGGYLGLDQPGGPVVLGVVVCTVTAAARGRRWWVWGVLAGGLVVSGVVTVGSTGAWPAWGRLTALGLGTVGLGLLAELVRERTARFAEMRRRGEERSRRQASDERLQLAQELHDVLAHDVSLMNVQASTALHLFDDDPNRARDALAAIKEVSHETLQELRATVSALRTEDAGAPLQPAAVLADVESLAARSTAAGLAVTVRRSGDVRPLPQRVELAGFRLVQEAVTNARRHSGAASATVTLDYGTDALSLSVLDRGRGRVADRPDGHGLVGMRERVHALGGDLDAGTAPGGGFLVRARLPLGGGGHS